MSRTTSIAGVRPLGWLARVRAQCSCLAWACPVQCLALRGWRQSRRWAWERAMTMRVSAWGQAKGGADGKAKLHAPEARDRQSTAAHESITSDNEVKVVRASKTSPIRQSDHLTF